MKLASLIASTILMVFSLGCGSSDGGSSNSSIVNPLTSSYGTLTSKLDSMDFSASSSLASSIPGGSLGTLAVFGTQWATDLLFVNPVCSSGCGNITTKDWMGTQIDPDSVRDNGSKISIFGRIDSALQIFCVIGVGLGSSGSNPADGSSSITFTATLKAQVQSQCSFSDASSIPDDTVVGLTISTPSNTTNFEKKVDIDLANLGGGTQTYYFKSSATNINVATTEDNSNGINRTVVFYDVTNDTVTAEYISGPDVSSLDDTNTGDANYLYAEFYRLFYDADVDEGHMMFIGGRDNQNGGGITFDNTSFVLSGKPNTTSGTFSLSMDSEHVTTGSAPHEACVNKETGDILSGQDGSRCVTSATGLNGYDVTTITPLSGFAAGYDSADYKTVGETTVLNFSTGVNFATAGISTN